MKSLLWDSVRAHFARLLIILYKVMIKVIGLLLEYLVRLLIYGLCPSNHCHLLLYLKPVLLIVSLIVVLTAFKHTAKPLKKNDFFACFPSFLFLPVFFSNDLVCCFSFFFHILTLACIKMITKNISFIAIFK